MSGIEFGKVEVTLSINHCWLFVQNNHN